MNWKRAGAWWGGTVSALAVSPRFAEDGLVLAATLAGVYRSLDGGRQWQPSLEGLTDLTTHTLLLTPDRGGSLTAFVATQYGRLYRSVAAGGSWEEVKSWTGLGVITSLAVSPGYAEDGSLFVTTAAGVFRSLDRGASWQSASFGLLDPEVLCLACDPDFSQNETLWVGTAAGGFYRSRNAGRAWRESGFGLPDSAVQCLALSPDFRQSKTMFAGTESAGVFYSTDGGANWAPAGQELSAASINCLAVSPDYIRDRTALAGTASGIFLSSDGGASWQPVGVEPAPPLALVYAKQAYVLAGSYGAGVLLSKDGGANWQPAIAGLAAHIPPLAVLGPQQELVLAALDGGIVFSQDRGLTWQAEPSGSAPSEVRLLAAGGSEIFAADSQRLYRTANLTQGWAALIVPLAGEAQLTLLALSAEQSHVLIGTDQGQLYLSSDRGESWQTLEAPPEGGMALQAVFQAKVEEASPELYLITGSESEPGRYRIQLWQRSLQPDKPWQALVTIEPVTAPIAALAIPQPGENAPLFLAIQNQVIRLARPAEGQPLEPLQVVLEETLNITGLVTSATPEAGYSLFVATNRGVFHSTDEGLHWQPLGQGLEARAVVALLVDSQQRLGVVTLGGEVWWKAE